MLNETGKKGLFMKKETFIRLPLQYFAEDGTGAGGENGGGAEGELGGSGNPEPKAPTFDDMLKNKEYQSEFDKRVTKALEKAKVKWDEETKAKLSEAEKLAKMNADQKAKYEQEQREAAMAKREADVTRRELTATAKETLAEKGLPVELSAVLDYTSAEKCSESIENVAKAFNSAVESKTNDMLRGNPPKIGDTKAQVKTYEQKNLI